MTAPSAVAPSTPPAPEGGATPPHPVQPPAPPEVAGLGDAGKQAIDAMKAERNAAKAERDALQRELQEIKDRDLSELDRAKKQAADTAAELESLRRTTLQQQVALTKGIPADLVSSLNGSTVDELAAHADRLLAWRNQSTPPTGPSAPLQPRPDLSQGATPVPPAAATEAELAQHMQYLRPNHR